MSDAYIVSGRRTPVGVRGGWFAGTEIADLAAPVIQTVLSDADVSHTAVDAVIMGNALYGGGNPARVAALAADLPERVPALTVDSQCCAGLDAIALARSLIVSGEADVVVAGGVESYSRAPIRQRRPGSPAEQPVEYARPPFTPWPDRDPDMLESAADLAARMKLTRQAQEAFAVASHRKARDDHRLPEEIVPMSGHEKDEFTRNLSAKTCARLNTLSGQEAFGVTAATTAVEADAAAAVLVVSKRWLGDRPRVVIDGSQSLGGDPMCPALAPVAAAASLLKRFGLEASEITAVEMMEAFAVQAIACVERIGLDPECVNRRGGALARGHPIGASGAILAVRLFHDLKQSASDAVGLAAIAAAGGIGSAMIVRGACEI